MKQTDYSKHKTLEEVVDSLYGNMASEHTIKRNECIANAAKQCVSAMELGVFQGSCLALIYCNLKPPKKMFGVDIKIKPYNNGGLKQLFEDYSQKNGYEAPTILEKSSIDPVTVKNVDFLHIDSLHRANHLMKELNLHSNNVNKYIAFHDINQNNNELGKVVKSFVEKNPQWVIAEYYDKGKCGHALIERK